MTRTSSKDGPRNLRQSLSTWEPGAHLYATAGTQFKGGLASILPFAIVYFTAQPFGQAMTTLTMGGFIIGPFFVSLFAGGWALLSTYLLYRLRFREDKAVHYATYAIAGAVALLMVALITITMVQGIRFGQWYPWSSPRWTTMLIGAPLVGAAGSVVGRWAIDAGVQWHIWIERKPLPQVFDFVDRRQDKDKFERM